MTKNTNKTFVVLLTLVLACLILAPATAFAEERAVSVNNLTTTQGQKTIVSDIRIGGVDAPEAGKQLDDKAEATTAEGAAWDIPLLWVRDDLKIMANGTVAETDRTYLPILVFFVPDDYALEGSDFKVTLSDELTALFGTEETISVYSAETGVTYIMPASLKNLFIQAASALVAGAPETIGEHKASEEQEASEDAQPTLVDIYCAQTARAALSDDDLMWLIDLIINRLEPQAVNLLLDKFPAFRYAAEKGEIGTQISLYIYYEEGDKDGDPSHGDTPEDALAYIHGDSALINGELRYCYMIGLDVDNLLKTNALGHPVIDTASGKYVLLRSGEEIDTLANTIVHELFHAFMDDYNRLGMFGTASLANRETGADNTFVNKETEQEYVETRYPGWFVEGSASSMENVYQYRNNLFKALTEDAGTESPVGDILYNYLNATADGKPLYYDLRYSSGFDEENNGVDTTTANYVTGYLAVLYLSDLAYRTENNGESAVSRTADGYVVSTEKLRYGLNYILIWLHDDSSTLDSVIAHISPVDDRGNKLYDSTESFTNQFIKGKPSETQGSETVYYAGDYESLAFVSQYLYCMAQAEVNMGATPNGSILFDIDQNFTAPLDVNKTDSADFYKIVESNTAVASSVSSNTGAIGGGLSYSSKSPYAGENGQTAGAANEAAAKKDADEPATEDASQKPAAEDDAAKQNADEPAVEGTSQEDAAESDAAEQDADEPAIEDASQEANVEDDVAANAAAAPDADPQNDNANIAESGTAPEATDNPSELPLAA